MLGAGGFIGSHLVRRLVKEGYWVRGVDLKHPDHWSTYAQQFIIGDLRKLDVMQRAYDRPLPTVDFDEVYQLAADMGGAGYLFVGTHDADIMHNSAQINLNTLAVCKHSRVFYASSACVYPEYNQLDPNNPLCREDTVYPAEPESEYGWEKLFSERLYLTHAKRAGLDVRIGRFHNIFGPYGTWAGGKEKAPAALCRKVAQALKAGGAPEIELWGDGEQSRSFLYIDEAIEAVRRLMASETFAGPVNIGSDERVTLNQLVSMISEIAGQPVKVKHVPGPVGVRGRSSDNALIEERLGWRPTARLADGLATTYGWISSQVDALDDVKLQNDD